MPELVQFPTGLSSPQDFSDMLIPYFPGAETPIINSQLLTVLRDFCSFAQVWQLPAPPLVLQATIRTYAVSSPVPNTEVGAVLGLMDSANGEWSPITPKQGWAIQYRDMTSKFFWSNAPGELTLAHVPSNVAELSPYVSLIPRALTNLPDWLLSRYQMTLCKGVMASMYQMTQKTWTSGTRGERLEKIYRAERATHRVRAITGNTLAEIPWRFPKIV